MRYWVIVLATLAGGLYLLNEMKRANFLEQCHRHHSLDYCDTLWSES